MRRFAYIFVCLWLVNFCAWVTNDSLMGGSPSAGKRENGKYYVGYRRRYTEVSRRAYEFARLHELSLSLMTVGVVLIGLDATLSKSRWGDRKWSELASRKKKRLDKERGTTETK